MKKLTAIVPCKNEEHNIDQVLESVKWVDEVIPGSPYVMTDEYLQWVMKEYKIDYVIHGDDPW